ncbi:MAG: hypothetical protein EA362_05385 [Saprospirales bacterium]|nr:MAG: hypothetical protein EA362_05385 [Saprospirales bacterium]
MVKLRFTLFLLLGLLFGIGLNIDLQAQEVFLKPMLIDSFELDGDEILEFSDSTAAMIFLNEWLSENRGQGFIASSIDGIEKIDSLWTVELYQGIQYKWVELDLSQISSQWLRRAGLRPEFFHGATVSQENLTAAFAALGEATERNGYPFASVGIDTFSIEGEDVWARVYLNEGPLIVFDGVELIGDQSIAPYYLASYLDVRPGNPYDSRTINSIINRIDELPFTDLRADPIVRFIDNKATIILDLESVNASRIDFVIGFLPRDEIDNRLLITGNLTGEFYNQLGLGERFFIDFQRIRPQTQDVELAFTYPYFLDLPFGLDTRFELNRRDSLFLDISYNIGVEYLISGGSLVRLFLDNKRSNLLSIDRASILSSGNLPDRLDYGRTGIGLAYELRRFDFRWNPTSGYSIKTNLSLGRRNISKNDQILNLSTENTDFNALYDSLSLESTSLNLHLEGTHFFRLSSLMTIKTKITTAWIYNSDEILFNELFRIGGNKLMRGFDEESIPTSAYVIGTVEYRLITGRRSYFFAFADLGYIENKSRLIQTYNDFLQGYGLGMTFDTAAGIFSLSAALGKQRDTEIDYRRTKIHFGYVSLF